ncbi:hypothetical protein P8C59_003087 [Phyllachora maydis]|uniref:Polyprotein n=1 Tax=Phyllachora maydis TaxID=1825666 RepID=A0AAD9HZQ1_9PEZI|nr:hypothetical protein P8C59_003087 [Phyllachora maydis]
MLGLKASSLNIEYLMADILEESRNPAIEAYRAGYVANSSNSAPNSNSNPSKKGKNKKNGKKKASYNIKGQNYSAKSAKQASFMLGSYNLAIEEEEESNSSSNSSSSSDSNTQLAQLLALKGYRKRKDFKGKGLKTSSNKAKYKDNKPRRRPRDPALYNMVEIPSNSIRKEDYRPIIEDAIVSEAIEPKKRYKLRNSPAKGTTLEVIEGNKVVEKAISSPTLKEPNIVLKTSTIKFIKDNIVLSQPTNNTALEGELVDLDLDLERAVSPDHSNLNTEKPISIEIGPKAFPQTIEPIFASKPIEVIAPNQPITNEPLNNSDLFLERDKMQLDYYKLLAKTSIYILAKLSNSSNTTTKLGRDFHSKEGPRPLTTTSTTIVDSRNGKGSSRTSIINSSLVPIGFSNSDFAGDKATSKSTYGYLYKLVLNLAGRPISWKTRRATTIALSTLEAETDGLTEAIREVQWIIRLFSKLYRPIDHPITLYRDNRGSITVANDPALHARTEHTLLKFRYVREQVKAKIVTIIYLDTKFNSTGYFTAL